MEARAGAWKRESRRWPLLVLLLSLAPVAGLLTTSRIFFVRDLSLFFWSRHLWLRHTIFAGQAPWWDPHVAGGQSAIADALNQLVMPLTLAIRLLPSDVVSFNLWVALPLPVAALGMFTFLRRRFGPGSADSAAALGAAVFVLSGPVVSMLNAPNLSWSVALMPWVVAGESVTWTAVAYGLQGLCGEPVTWAATAVIAMAADVAGPRRPVRGARVLAGLMLGSLLAAAQLVPTVVASVDAHRSELATPDFWSLHPLSLWECVAPHLFGNYYDALLDDLPWMGALNFGRDPFFYSIYVGPAALLLACAGAIRLRANAVWVGLAIAFTIAAMGGYTPLYPMLRHLVPALLYFRFPVKYLVPAVFAVAVLAADGWRRLSTEDSAPRRALLWAAVVAGSAGVVAALVLLATPGTLHDVALVLASATRLKDPDAGADAFVRAAPLLAVRLGATLAVTALLGRLARNRAAAWWLLAAATCVDLAVTNGGLNPTIDVARQSPPAWFTASAGPSRLYIGGRVRGFMNSEDPDAPATWQLPDESTAARRRTLLNAELPMAPSGWHVREALSYDLPHLWPAEYETTVRRFEDASPEERGAFLRRTAVRWCVLPAATRQYDGEGEWPVVADVPDWNMRVFDCHPDASRLAFAREARGLDALFDPRLADAEDAGQGHIEEDRPSHVAIDVTMTRSALLVLRDTYDPEWHAEVDGSPAPVVRVNGIQRGVQLPAGHHVVRFTYRPRNLLVGLTLSGMGLVIVGFFGFSRFSGFGFSGSDRTGRTRNLQNPLNPKNPENPEPPRRPSARGFTLIELMIVLAILAIVLAVAFTEYRQMQARGNEASAVSSLRSIVVAQSQFSMTCGNLKYAATLPALGQPVPTTGEPFLSPDLTSAETIEKSGYSLHMASKPLTDAPPACNGAAVADGYAVTADPTKPRLNGFLYYGVNADRIMYVDDQKSFKEDLPESGAARHGHEMDTVK